MVHARSEYTVHDDNVDMDHLNTHGITIPLLTGLEAFAACTTHFRTLRHSNMDTGCLETSSEFAKQIKGYVCFVGPRCAQEDGSTKDLTSSLSNTSPSSSKRVNEPKTLSGSSGNSAKQHEKLTIKIPARSRPSFKDTSQSLASQPASTSLDISGGYEAKELPHRSWDDSRSRGH